MRTDVIIFIAMIIGVLVVIYAGTNYSRKDKNDE